MTYGYIPIHTDKIATVEVGKDHESQKQIIVPVHDVWIHTYIHNIHTYIQEIHMQIHTSIFSACVCYVCYVCVYLMCMCI